MQIEILDVKHKSEEVVDEASGERMKFVDTIDVVSDDEDEYQHTRTHKHTH